MPRALTDARRTAVLVTAAASSLSQQAAKHRETLKASENAQKIYQARLSDAAAAKSALTEERARLEQLIIRKTSLFAALRGEERVLEREAAKAAETAKDLRDLIDRLAMAPSQPIEPPTRRVSPPAPPAPPVIAAVPQHSSLPYPVHGTIAAAFRKARDGRHSAGIWMTTMNGAQVVAPHNGTILFAGPFRSYGRLLIVEHGEGYHTLLAGMARIDGTVGQTVRRGEPVGIMGYRDSGTPELYVEIRKNGQPVDPVSWLTSESGKVSG